MDFKTNYQKGYRNGHLDRLIGLRLDINFLPNPNLPGYYEGYRKGILDLRSGEIKLNKIADQSKGNADCFRAAKKARARLKVIKRFSFIVTLTASKPFSSSSDRLEEIAKNIWRVLNNEIGSGPGLMPSNTTAYTQKIEVERF